MYEISEAQRQELSECIRTVNESMKEAPTQNAEITIHTQFSEGHAESWRNEVAMHLNVLLGRAVYFRETSNDESDQKAEAATLAIVNRVAEFESIIAIPNWKGQTPKPSQSSDAATASITRPATG